LVRSERAAAGETALRILWCAGDAINGSGERSDDRRSDDAHLPLM